MSVNRRKFLFGLIAAVAAVFYAAFLSAPYEVAPNGTVEGQGIGFAIELLIVWALVYGALWFGLGRVLNDKGADQG